MVTNAEHINWTAAGYVQVMQHYPSSLTECVALTLVSFHILGINKIAFQHVFKRLHICRCD